MNVSYVCVFFTVAALFAFDVGFGAFDLFLEFVLVHFLHEFSTGDDEKVIEVVYGATPSGYYCRRFRRRCRTLGVGNRV